MKTRIEDALFNLKMWWQRKTRGYSDAEVWNLDDTFCKWILPRLREFRKGTIGYPNVLDGPNTFEEWQYMLDEMLFGFEWTLNEDDWYDENVATKGGGERIAALEEFSRNRERAQLGRELFGKWMTHLWW